MKSNRFFLISLVILLFVLSLAETAQAQRRKRDRAHKTRVVVVRRPHHAMVVRKAHVRYAGLPRWGTVVTAVPDGAVVIKSRKHPYYFHNGIFYARRTSGFVIARPMPGFRIRVLPVGYRTVVIGPRNYYYYYGTFYVKSGSAPDEYVVADAPEGAVVDALPEGYEVKIVDGKEYYELEGVYYAEVDAPEFEDNIGYEVIKI